jgi:hypothetical protein
MRKCLYLVSFIIKLRILTAVVCGDVGCCEAAGKSGLLQELFLLYIATGSSLQAALSARQGIANASTVLVMDRVARFQVLPPMTMKNAVFWNMKTKYVPHRKHITSLLQNTTG